MEVKSYMNNTRATAKRWPQPLNRGGRWIEVTNTAEYWQINQDFGKWPLNGGWPLNRGRTVLHLVQPLPWVTLCWFVLHCRSNCRIPRWNRGVGKGLVSMCQVSSVAGSWKEAISYVLATRLRVKLKLRVPLFFVFCRVSWIIERGNFLCAGYASTLATRQN